MAMTIISFWSKVRRGPSQACWLWQGGVNSKGYGVLRVNGRSTYAHRFSYELEHGQLPPCTFVLHHCDTPRCVNPAHHFLGGHKENREDCVKKGRHSRGNALPYAKLDEHEVRIIRQRLDLTCRQLAGQLGVCKSTIQQVRQGLTWKHV